MTRQPRDLAHGVALFLKKTNMHELIQVEHEAWRLSGNQQAIMPAEVKPT